MKEQGCLRECVYCSLIHPELKESKNCPKCHGTTPYFQPARMMDKYSRNEAILYDLFPETPTLDNSKQFEFYYGLLEKIDIYNIDLKEALIQKLIELEQTE